jgi:SAM-dependent methyltransferase
MPADAYDDLPYTDHAYAESHPDRLAVVARLSGWEPPSLEGARVLELGCGRGGNLLPMASSLPGATLIGIDRSLRQIAEARRVASGAGVANVTFHAETFEQADAAVTPGGHDFVLCHGVYSWVPVSTRRALLGLIARALAPGGIAYVSFNTLPGWYERLAARDWLRFSGDPDAGASLAWLAEHVSPELRTYRQGLEAVVRRLKETDRTYAVHEYLAREHHPESVTTFLGEAEAAGLSYLGDAIPGHTALELLPEPVAARARSLDVTGAQQLVDYVRGASFRRALLVRAPGAGAWQAPRSLQPAALESLRVASRLKSQGPATATEPELFASEGGAVQVTDPATRHALHELARVAPRSLRFADLVDLASAGASRAQRDALAAELLDLWLASDGLDLHAHEPALATRPVERPAACPVARWHATHGGALTNLWHQEVLLAEPVVRFLLGRLDGTRTVASLVTDTRLTLFKDRPGEASGIDLDALVRGGIALLAASGLLVEPRPQTIG